MKSCLLAKTDLNKIKTKDEFRALFYAFHNFVNKKKSKPLYNFELVVNKYSSLNIINVYNNFISIYNTKGNMKLLTETFQRTLILKDFRKWFLSNLKHFNP